MLQSWILLLISSLVGGEASLIIQGDAQSIAGASVIAYDCNMDSIASYTSDIDGKIEILQNNADYVKITHPLYMSQLVELDSVNNGIVTLKQAVNLQELEVVASNHERNLTHESYKLSMSQMKDYQTFYDALSEIPHLHIMPEGGLYLNGYENVALLLNGVETSKEELMAISKEDISKVNIYRTPTPRFAAQGYSGVVDVITKSNLTGGNLSLNIDQSFLPMWGENNLIFNYNYKRSKFSVEYNNENLHQKDYRENATLEYKHNGILFRKEKIGLDSPSNKDLNGFQVSYQNNLANDYLYNAKVGGNWISQNKNLSQDVTSNGSKFLANNVLDYTVKEFWIGNYFDKKIGKDGDKGTIIANVRYNHYATDYHSGYKEYEDGLEKSPTEDHHNYYNIRNDAIFGEADYNTPDKSWGSVSAALFGYYKNNRYEDREAALKQREGVLGGLVFYYGWKGKLQYNASVGAQYTHINTHMLSYDYSRVSPRGGIGAYYYPNDKITLGFSYNYNTTLPDVAQLSETNQWLDTRLIYHGNASLKPYFTHSINLNVWWSNKYAELNLRGSYLNEPGKICSQYEYADEYFIETITNLKKYQTLIGTLQATLYPIGNKKLSFFNRVIWGHIWGNGANYIWSSPRFQWNSSLTYRISRWSFSGSYQYPGIVSDGQLERPRAQYWAVSFTYSPLDNLYLGLRWGMPFGKYLKESERSVRTSLVHTQTTTFVGDWANRIVLTLSWNLNFGKNQNNNAPRMDTTDEDRGLLTK